ncbi:MAG: thiamine-phosphate kinase [Gammaproteobacteria bacterium]
MPPELVLGPGDDCALVDTPEGEQLCVSVDSLVAGIHFPVGAPPALGGYRALAVSLSDLAAMGAKPIGFLVALTAENPDADWVREFARGMAALARPLGIGVAGGNLASGPLNVTITVFGSVPRGRALRRDGAKPGDQVFVSGRLGDGHVGLGLARDYRQGDLGPLQEAKPGSALYPIARYFLPTPRLELGLALRGLASAVIDLSDGLLADLGHVCRASGVGATLEVSRVPLNAGVMLEDALAGDDYELCFTAPSEHAAAIAALAKKMRIDLTLVGSMKPGSEITCVDASGMRVAVQSSGYRHFR